MNKIRHIGICATDIDRTVNWYSRWFGFREVKRFEKAEFEIKGALMSLGDFAIEVLVPKGPLETQRERSGIIETFRQPGTNHIAIEVDDVTALYEKCLAEGVPLVTDLVDGRFFFCKDPDGTVLEIRAGQ